MMPALKQSSWVDCGCVDLRVCPDENMLCRLLAPGALSALERGGLEAHLDGCEACRELVAALVRSGVPSWRSPL